MSVTLAPQITAAPQESRTPIFPLPLRGGLELLEPKPHTIADTISARTLRMRPMVITAPTMVRSWLMPGRPESFGSMSMSIGTSAANEATVSVARVRMVMAGRSFVAPARGVLASRCAALRSEERRVGKEDGTRSMIENSRDKYEAALVIVAAVT